MNEPLGNLPRFDYTHNKAQALASEESGTLFFTTDYFLVFNGAVWTKNAPVYIAGQETSPGVLTNFRQSDGSILLPSYSAGTQVKGDAETDYRTGQVNITKANIGLGNVTNDTQIPLTQKGVANGVAELDENGKVPTTQLPSYVDDVVEVYPCYKSGGGFYFVTENGKFKDNADSNDFTIPNMITLDQNKLYLSFSDNKLYRYSSNNPNGYVGSTPEADKVYVETYSNKTYRYSGSIIVPINPSIALGETSGTAYRGDRGKIAYDHAIAKGSAFSSGLYKITVNSEGHVTAATAVTKSDITGLGIAASDQLNNYAYHHTPTTDDNETLDASTGHVGDYPEDWVIQKIKRDGKGHVTDIVARKVITSHQNKEDVSNKRTSVRAVSSATDTEYPSEKAVATAIASLQSQIDALTSALNSMKWK